MLEESTANIRNHRDTQSKLLALEEHVKALEKKVYPVQKKEQPYPRRNSSRTGSIHDNISEHKALATPSQDLSYERKTKKLSKDRISSLRGDVAKSKEEVSNFFL